MPTSVAFSPDGKMLAISDESGPLYSRFRPWEVSASGRWEWPARGITRSPLAPIGGVVALGVSEESRSAGPSIVDAQDGRRRQFLEISTRQEHTACHSEVQP